MIRKSHNEYNLLTIITVAFVQISAKPLVESQAHVTIFDYISKT